MGQPLAYFITFSTYGTHLPGSDKGWVDKRHRIPGSPVLIGNERMAGYWEARLKEPAFVLKQSERGVVLEAVLGVCVYKGWVAHGVHVRTNHIHAVVGGEAKPERMMAVFKSYATRGLRANRGCQRERFWTDHGSTRYLWKEVSVKAAVEYVLNGQGTKMECFPDGA
jgi:hypothetical protein